MRLILPLLISALLAACAEKPAEPKKLSLQEMDEMMSKRISACWTYKLRELDVTEPAVTLSVEFNENGAITKVEADEPERLKKDKRYKKSFDMAKDSLGRCAPFDFLPPEQYADWKSIHIRYDPKDVDLSYE